MAADKLATGIASIAEGRLLDKHGEPVVECYAVLPLREALEHAFDTDAHLVTYVVAGEEFQPRINKPGLSAVEAETDAAVQVQVFFADLDNPGHALWTEEARAVARAQEAALPVLSTCGIYDTAKGRRIVQPLENPVPAREVEPYLARWLGQLKAAGLVVDEGCDDWTRHFRLPHVLRDGQPFHSPYVNLKHMRPIAVQPIHGATPAAVSPSPSTRKDPPANLELLTAAAAALALHGPAVEGQHGDNHTFRAAALLRRDFALTEEEAWPLILAWNQSCRPPWSEADLRTKLVGGLTYGTTPVGRSRDFVGLGEKQAAAQRLPNGEIGPTDLRKKLRARGRKLDKSADLKKLQRALAIECLGPDLKHAQPFGTKDDLWNVLHEAARQRAPWPVVAEVVRPSANLTDGWAGWEEEAEGIYQQRLEWWADWRAKRLGESVEVQTGLTYGGCLTIMRRPDFSDRVLRGEALEFNDLTQAPEVGRKPLTDARVNKIRESTERAYSVPAKDSSKPAAFDKTHVWDALFQLADERHYHPVTEYLRALRWDGTRRVERFAVECLRVAQPTKIQQRALRCWFIGTAARGLRPGCKMDGALVLVGPQAAKKSLLFEKLGGPFYLPFDADFRTRDGQQISHGGWILEWAELASIRNATVESVKAFISKTVDTWVGKWQRAPTVAPRGFVIVGSTNEEDFLKDATGNRRFWPIRVGGTIDLERVQAWRDQLWAEAVTAVGAGESWWLSEDEEAGLRREQAPFEDCDPWEAKVQEYLTAAEKPPSKGDAGVGVRRPVTTDNVLRFLAIPVERCGDREQKRVGRILRRLGYERERGRVDGQRAYTWQRPNVPSPRSPEGTAEGTAKAL
ncbi:MAG TPA: virulence-associated E family protein [Myxococcales bacterium]